MHYYFHSPSMSETMYYLNDHMDHLENIADLKKISSSIEYQSSETYLWKSHIPSKAQVCQTDKKDTGKLQSEH